MAYDEWAKLDYPGLRTVYTVRIEKEVDRWRKRLHELSD